ncbi:MAG: FecR domain-containing protein [Patescibacteria group bacterium]
MTYREPTPDELLSALEGKALPGDAHDALLQLGHVLRRAAPPVEEPNMFFASRLKAKLAAAPMPQPRVPIAALLLPLVGVIAIAAVVFAFPRTNPAAPAASDAGREVAVNDAAPKVFGLGGELTLVVGNVQWRATAADAWQAASEGAQINPGSELDVPGDGRAVVTLDDGSAVRLNGKTTLAFASVVRNAVEIRESRGTAYYRVVKDPNRTFTVVTEEGTVTALGTAFAVARDADKKTLNVHVLESKVKIALAKDGTKLEKELGQGKTLSYDGTKSPDTGTKESVIDPQKIAVVPFFAWNISEDAKEGAPLGIATGVKELALATESGDTEKVAALTVEEKPALAAVAPEPKPVPAPAPTPTSTGIVLSGSVSGTTAVFSWKVNGVDVANGFKLVTSLTPNPVYPGNTYQYLSDPVVRSYTWKGLQGGTILHFRVCAYNGNGACGVYSNDVELKTGTVAVKPPSGYTLLTSGQQVSVQQSPNGMHISWTPSLVANFLYYKVVRSETNGDLYYPNDGYLSVISDKSASSYTDTTAVSGKDYYYRICSKDSDGVVWCGNVVRVTTE